MLKLEKGTEIYYGGDMANSEGFGIITETGNIGYGDFVNIKMEDGRDIKQLSVNCFSEEYLGHGGTRFVTKKAYKKWKQEMADRFYRKYILKEVK